MPGASSYKAVYVLRALVFCLDPYSLPLCLSRQTSLGGRKKKKPVVLLLSILQDSFLPLPAVQGKLVMVVE